MKLGHEMWIKIKNTPLDIKLFFLFSVLITLVSWFLYLDSNKEIKEQVIPYTGWGFGRSYEFPVYFIPLYVLTSKRDSKMPFTFLRFYIIVVMLMELYYGIEAWISVSPENYTSTNPYIRYDALTPIYTIALPLFWLLVMAGNLINSYMKNDKKIRVI